MEALQNMKKIDLSETTSITSNNHFKIIII